MHGMRVLNLQAVVKPRASPQGHRGLRDIERCRTGRSFQASLPH